MSVKTLPSRVKTIRPRHTGVSSRNVRSRTAQWYRDVAELKRQHPFCQECEKRGEQTVATQTDHKVPLVLGGSSHVSNLQRLCDDCHEAKTKREEDKRYVY